MPADDYTPTMEQIIESIAGDWPAPTWDEAVAGARGWLAAHDAERDELREKVSSLRQGCLDLTRDELIGRITAVGPAEWKAGHWLSQRDAKRDALRDAELREQIAKEIDAVNVYDINFTQDNYEAGVDHGLATAARIARGKE